MSLNLATLSIQGGSGGRIINTISLAGLAAVGYDGTHSWAGYCAAKFGNVAYTQIFEVAKTFESEESFNSPFLL